MFNIALEIIYQMAIWQYTLLIIPKANFERAYSAFVNQPVTQYRKNISDFWEETIVDSENIENGISELIPKADFCFSDTLYFKSPRDIGDNDCSIYFKKGKIVDFNIRIDLRTDDLIRLLKGLVIFCNKNSLLLMNLHYEIVESEINKLLEDIKKSNNLKFLTDPIKFLEDLK